MYKVLIILLIVVSFNSCKRAINEGNTDIEKFYNKNKNFNIGLFKNWQVQPRSDGKYLFDFLLNEEEIRYFVFESTNNELLCKQIFPTQDTLFTDLNIEKLNDRKLEVLFLYQALKSLQVNAIIYIPENDLYFIEESNFYIVYSEKELKDLKNIRRFANYSKLDNHWFYLETEK
ncbi:MAG: hypothetical protein B6D64_08460 [Bacteroidetes bacterium 4484_276]|nr:MAG: hypothetical protein B6D64_08460 [Bacteroidetes bacterium 4484_276]